MAISAQLVKQLRDRTGAGMMDCKKALVQTDGDIEAAAEFLQKKGIAKAAKKAGRVAAEGLVETWTNSDETEGVIVEINCETDFVSRNEKFQTFVQSVTAAIGESGVKTIEEALALDYEGDDLENAIKETIATIGENIQLRRFDRFKVDRGLVADYIHAGNQIAVLIEVSTESDADETTADFARDVAMHIAAMSPGVLSADEIDEELASNQESIFTAQIKEEGKPEKIIPRIVQGKMEKWRKEHNLLDQAFVKNPDLSVSEYQAQTGGVEITGFLRYQVGEGIEKEESSLADEVAQLQG